MALKNLLSSKKDVFGLDIGSSYVRAVQLRKEQDKYTLISASEEPIRTFGQGILADSTVISGVLKKCIKGANIHSKYAVCGVCGPEVATRRFRFSEISESEIDDAVLFEAEQACPFDSGRFIVDYQLLSNETEQEDSDSTAQKAKMTGILVAATPKVIGDKAQIVRAASLNCVLIDVNGLALLNCFTECEKLNPDETIAIVDIGSKYSNVAIISDHGLPFIRDFAYGSIEIVKQVASDIGVSIEEAEKKLFTDSMVADQTILDSLDKACTKLILDITETLRYYAIQQGDAVEKIYLCGGFAQCNGLASLLNSNLPPNVVLWNPFNKIESNFGSHGTELVQSYGCRFAVAAGLAMRTI